MVMLRHNAVRKGNKLNYKSDGVSP